MKIKLINKQIIFKYLTIFLFCLLFANAKVGTLNPFLFAYFFACLYVGVDEKLIAVFTLLSSTAVDWSLQNLYISLTVVATGLICFYIHKLIKRKMKLPVVFVAFIISLATYMYYNFFNLEMLAYYISLGLISLFIFIVVLQVCLLRKNCFKLTLDEGISFLFAVAIVGLGLSGVEIQTFSICRMVIALIIFVCSATGSLSLTLSLVLALSLGVAVGTGDLIFVAEFLTLAMIANVFKLPHKFKMIILTFAVEIFIQFYFITKSWVLLTYVAPVVVAGIIFILIPNKMLSSLTDLIYIKKSEISSRNVINITRKNLKKRMAELSNIFLDMQNIHLNMIKKNLTKDELVAMLVREVTATCCRDCLEKNRCNRSLGTDNKSNLNVLVEIAVEKGKVSLLDIPSSLGNRCAKVNHLITLINRLVDEYRQYKNMMADVNNVKILLADQMGAVSRLLLDVGDEIDANVKFDVARENKIISKLLNKNVFCKEVLIYSEKNQNFSVVLIVKSDCLNSNIFEKIVTEVLKIPMEVAKITPLEEMDYTSVLLKQKSKYDCIFGLSGCNKSGNEECGDCHSIIRLSNNRFLLALCDGMGSGKNAHMTSAMTLGLIENFYKVGFDNDVILESVNKLLAVSNQENYSTLDVCLLDLDKEIADFIKVGAPSGIIKRESKTELVEGGALPIGALDNITPSIFKTTISVKDIIIMVTDGITDAFGSNEELMEFASKQASNNPQTLADSILNQALLLNEMSAKDDMTVLVARTYLKN